MNILMDSVKKYLWAKAIFSRSFSYLSCCSECGPDSVDELFSDELCLMLESKLLFAFMFSLCDGLSGLAF